MLTLNAKYLKATNPLVMNGEFRCGGMEVGVTTKEYLYQALLWMGYGFHGVNYFMLVERHRWPNTPIDWVGRPMNDDLYKTFKKICQIYNTLKPNEMVQHSVASIGLLWYRPQLYLEKDSITEPGYHTEPEHGFNQIFNSLVYGNIMFEVIYPNFDYIKMDSLKYIIVAGTKFMDAQTAVSLKQYAERGGHLIFYYSVPTKNAAGEPLKVFSEIVCKPDAIVKLGASSLSYFHDLLRNKRASISLDSRYAADFDVSSLKNLEKTFSVRNLTIGYTVTHGKGLISVIGFELNQKMINPVLGLLGFENPLKISNSEVLGTIYCNKQSGEIMMSVINIDYQNAQKVSFSIDGKLLGMEHQKYEVQQYVNPKKYAVNSLRFDAIELGPQSGEIYKIIKS